MNKEDVLQNLEQVKNWIKESEEPKEVKKTYLEIKNRWTGSVIWKSEKTTMREAVEEAVKAKADLSYADLTNANLSKADLSEANLTNANLTKAKVDGCIFYMGFGNRNFEALCKAIKTLKHNDGTFDELTNKNE